MILDSFLNSGVVASSRLAMEASWRSYAEASHNLSNADTPGYSPTHTDFKSVLLEKQSAEMPPKGEAFQAYLQDLNQQYSGLRSAIYEGKR